nr:hypothetical protein [Flavobacterium sp.]
SDFGHWNSLSNDTVTLNDKITVLGFPGQDIVKNRSNLFNLNLKVYQRYHKFDDLQFVYVCPIGTEKEAAAIVEQFAVYSDVSHYKFVFAPVSEIADFHRSLKLKQELNADFGTPYVYLIDKERNLRGRKDDTEYKEGYNTFYISEISNEMLDDFKVILYEYRAALKKNNNASKRQI